MAYNMKFRLVFGPCQTSEKPKYIDNVQNYLQMFKDSTKQYGIYVKQFGELDIENKKDSFIIELAIEVFAKYTIHACSTTKEYDNLCKKFLTIVRKWCNLTELDLEPPQLMITNPRAFKRLLLTAHKNISFTDFNFGVLPFINEFISFLSLKNNITCINFYYDQINKIEILFHMINGNQNYGSLIITFKTIRKIIVNITENACVELYLDLLHPPLLYTREDKKKFRDTGLSEVQQRKVEMSAITSLILGRANVLKITLPNYDISLEIISRLRFRCSGLPVYYGHILQTHNTLIDSYSSAEPPNEYFTDFACQYLLTAIFYKNFSTAIQCKRTSLSKLRGLNNAKYLEKALTDLLWYIDNGNIIYFPQALIFLCEYYDQITECNDNFVNYIVPDKSRLIKRVTITPTRKLLWPPEIMFENRVLRNFDPEYAIRVTFREDDMSRLSCINNGEEQIFNNTIKNPMLHGIQIGCRLFEFLGWSNSQIRDHGVWCYACDSSGRTANDIRIWVGDLSKIKIVPKYMARIGQSFSQTENTVSVPLDSDHVRFEADIQGGLDPITNEPYCFSDGIGRISTELANKVHEALGHDMKCSAFQIRYGGCKGMLVIDPTLTDTDIVFRESMKKFESPGNIQLEIARVSSPIALQLNRPFITILDQLGVPSRIFLQLQEQQLRELTDILLVETEAVKYLKAKTQLDIFKFKGISNAGVELTTEPFFRSLLLSLHKYYIDKVKTSANISIPPEQGRNMLGVLDETGTLEYGQVFVQYTRDIMSGQTNLDTVIVTGTVVVTKNPCMHPGDVRKFTAIDVPALHHIVDCIVFPQKGPRPHPNEMAGSDMDGDEYTVIWKTELIFPRSNVHPADFSSQSVPEVLFITVHDIITFLIQYIKCDNLGVIANAHLAQADLLKEGIFHPLCTSIANKFSIVVDCAKSGIRKELSKKEKPEEYPDFMEKHYQCTYKSKRALGKLYRVCKDFELTNISAIQDLTEIKVDPLLKYSGWEQYEASAIKSRDKYYGLLMQILQTYGVQEDVEAFSGAFSSIHGRFRERNDKIEIQKIVIESIKTLCKSMRKEFYSDFPESEIDRDFKACNMSNIATNVLQKASAWYIVTYSTGKKSLLSFPWIMSDILINIRLGNMEHRRTRNVNIPVCTKIDIIFHNNLNFIPPLSLETTAQLNEYNFTTDKPVIELALRVMMLWAFQAHIISDVRYPNRGFLYRKVFAHLFLDVASKIKTDSLEANNKQLIFTSSALLCIKFLCYCITLRFLNKTEVNNYLPFHVYKYKDLGSMAMVNYHDIAITGTFTTLLFNKECANGLHEMQQEYINSSIFEYSPIPEHVLKYTENKLCQETGVNAINLREYRSISKVIVSALGTHESLLRLKKLLRKQHKTLKDILQLQLIR